MATSLIQIAFTAEAIARLVETPENRLEAVIPLVESLGGRFHGSWMSFGEYDSTAVIEMPDAVTIKAFEMAAMAGGGLRLFHVTPLMSFEDGMEAMRVANGIAYRAPGRVSPRHPARAAPGLGTRADQGVDDVRGFASSAAVRFATGFGPRVPW